MYTDFFVMKQRFDTSHLRCVWCVPDTGRWRRSRPRPVERSTTALAPAQIEVRPASHSGNTATPDLRLTNHTQTTHKQCTKQTQSTHKVHKHSTNTAQIAHNFEHEPLGPSHSSSSPSHWRWITNNHGHFCCCPLRDSSCKNIWLSASSNQFCH